MKKSGPEPTDVHVGRRVRMRRMMLGMSQEKLGDALGITFQQVQKYEKGTNRISASRLQRTAEVLQVLVPFFFEGLPDGAGAPSALSRRAMCPISLQPRMGSISPKRLRIQDAQLRRSIVNLVEGIAGSDEND